MNPVKFISKVLLSTSSLCPSSTVAFVYTRAFHVCSRTPFNVGLQDYKRLQQWRETKGSSASEASVKNRVDDTEKKEIKKKNERKREQKAYTDSNGENAESFQRKEPESF